MCCFNQNFARRALAGVFFLCFAATGFAQTENKWPNQPVLYTSAPQLNAPQTPPNENPFKNPVNVAQAQPLVPPAPTITYEPYTPPTPTAAPLTEASAAQPSEPPSAEEVADQLGKEAAATVEAAKNDLYAAVRGDRNAQVRLATHYLLPIAKFIAILIIASWIGRYLGGMVTNLVGKRVDLTLGRFAGNLTRIAVVFVTILGLLGERAASLAGIVAALGFAVGMALQGTLGSFASGIALLIFRPFKVGDYIRVDGEEGTVNAIELFTTTINTADNRHIIVPNANVFGEKIENWSHNSLRRVDVPVGVAYNADLKQTRSVLQSAVQNIDGADAASEPQVYLCDLGASSVDWSCRVWCKPGDYLAVRERVTEAVKYALDQHGIGIPFPQLDLHVVTPGSQQKLAA